MRGRTLLIILGVFVMVVLLTRCGSTQTVRYRMTVEVETPQGLRTGSSVREVTAYSPWVINPSSRTHFDLSGEAVAVDLPDGRVLFALLTGADGVDYAALLPGYHMGWLSPEGIAQGPVPLWPNTLSTVSRARGAAAAPMLVTFGNLRDPMSVTEVDPANLSAQFGEGVRLRRITVQVTDDDVTEGIERRLVWLRPDQPYEPDPNFRPEGIPVGNFRGLFSSEHK
jgi:hypothetical protein